MVSLEAEIYSSSTETVFLLQQECFLIRKLKAGLRNLDFLSLEFPFLPALTGTRPGSLHEWPSAMGRREQSPWEPYSDSEVASPCESRMESPGGLAECRLHVCLMQRPAHPCSVQSFRKDEPCG